ncbi:MAG TPA: hypothetical protein VJ890_05920 [Vineibacter sp.]|nr:hypothetical protein [Vineibacter sp.]
MKTRKTPVMSGTEKRELAARIRTLDNAQGSHNAARNGGGLVEATTVDLRGKIPPLTTEEIAALTNGKTESVVIQPVNTQRAMLHLRGISPYCQHAFSQKAQAQMEATQRAGTQARSRKKREARDFEESYRAAQHISTEGWIGIPATGFRCAAIDTCRLVGFVMARAKLSLFIEEDGYDANDRTPLVKIIGEHFCHKGWARNANGTADLRWRPMWETWEVMLRVRWDGDQFSASDIFNLFSRAGLQVGVGEGRPSSPNSNGLGWGLWEMVR